MASTFDEIVIGNVVEIKNDTGTYNLKITYKTEDLAGGKRWNNSRGDFTKTSNFAISPQTKNVKIIS